MGRQTSGRDRNAALAGGRPDALTSEADIQRVGRQSLKKAGPDGPDAREVGDTFKRTPSSDSKDSKAGR